MRHDALPLATATDDVSEMPVRGLIWQEWLQTVESLLHISNIATMEHKLPREGDSTLWEVRA